MFAESSSVNRHVLIERYGHPPGIPAPFHATVVVARAMFHLGFRTKIILVALMLAGLTSLSCTTIRCAQTQTPGEPLITAGRSSGGIAPRMNILRVYSNGRLELEKLGRLPHCATVRHSFVAEIAAFIESDHFQSARSTQNSGFDWEEVWIEAGDRKFGIVIDEIPDELLPLFRLLDQLFDAAFGKRHDMPLSRTMLGTSPSSNNDDPGRSRDKTRGSTGPRLKKNITENVIMKRNLLLAVLILLTTAQSAPACLCPHMPTLEQETHEATAVFTGTVESVVPKYPKLIIWAEVVKRKIGGILRIEPYRYPYAMHANIARFRVIESLKGDWQSITLETSSIESSCRAYPLEVGREYLVFAFCETPMKHRPCGTILPLDGADSPFVSTDIALEYIGNLITEITTIIQESPLEEKAPPTYESVRFSEDMREMCLEGE